MNIEFKKKILKLLRELSRSKAKSFLSLVDRKLKIPFPNVCAEGVEAQIEKILKKVSFRKANEVTYIQLEQAEASLEDIYILIKKYNAILEEDNAINFIFGISEKKQRRSKILNDLFPEWLTVARKYHKILTLLRGGRYHDKAWAVLDFGYFQTTSQIFLGFARMAYAKKNVQIFCPSKTIRLNEHIPRYSKIIKNNHWHFYQLATREKIQHIAIQSDETIAKKYFEYAHAIFSGARICSKTGRFKNFFSKIGIASGDTYFLKSFIPSSVYQTPALVFKDDRLFQCVNENNEIIVTRLKVDCVKGTPLESLRFDKNTSVFLNREKCEYISSIGGNEVKNKGKERELKKEIRDEDTLALIKKIFTANLFEGKFHDLRQIRGKLFWNPKNKKHEDLFLFLYSITWDKRHNKPSALGKYCLNFLSESKQFSVRQDHAHFILITSSDSDVDINTLPK